MRAKKFVYLKSTSHLWLWIQNFIFPQTPFFFFLVLGGWVVWPGGMGPPDQTPPAPASWISTSLVGILQHIPDIAAHMPTADVASVRLPMCSGEYPGWRTTARVLLNVRPTLPWGGGGWVGLAEFQGGWVSNPPPPQGRVGLCGGLGSIEPVPLLSFFCCRFRVTWARIVCALCRMRRG